MKNRIAPLIKRTHRNTSIYFASRINRGYGASASDNVITVGDKLCFLCRPDPRRQIQRDAQFMLQCAGNESCTRRAFSIIIIAAATGPARRASRHEVRSVVMRARARASFVNGELKVLMSRARERVATRFPIEKNRRRRAAPRGNARQD